MSDTNKTTRRDAAKLALLGVAGAGMLGASQSVAAADDGRRKRRARNTVGTNTIDANAVNSISNAVNSARSPEEAYKTFVALATPKIFEVVASSLAQTLSGAANQVNNPNVIGWEGLVQGCVMEWDWGSPFREDALNGSNDVGGYFNSISPTVLSTVARAELTANVSGEVTCSGTFRF